MDRWKSLLQPRLVVPLVILGSAFVFWSTRADKRPLDVSKRHSASIVGPSSELLATPHLHARVAAAPLAPRLLPHSETCRCDGAEPRTASSAEPISPAAFPLAPQTVEPSATGSTVVQSATLSRRLPAQRQEARSEDAGPRYSWLLEGRADVPADQDFRSRELELIARQADEHTRRGFDLAGRRAYYSARSEFIEALRLVAQGLDAEHRTSVHGQALRAGLRALDEADDFVLSGPQLEAELNYQAIIEGHGTPVLKLSRPQTLTSIEALRRYFSFAQYQLAVAAGHEMAGSMALHALAKLYASSEDNPTLTIVSAKSKAMTCFQAALVAYPQNYMASNDLGVLLANAGRYDDARQILEASADNCPHSATWHNLSVVYRELGMQQLSERAEENHRSSLEQELAQRNARSPGASDPRVIWLSPEDFAKTYAQTADARQPLPVRSGAAMDEANNRVQVSPQPVEKQSPVVAEERSTSWSWNIFKNVLK